MSHAETTTRSSSKAIQTWRKSGRSQRKSCTRQIGMRQGQRRRNRRFAASSPHFFNKKLPQSKRKYTQGSFCWIHQLFNQTPYSAAPQCHLFNHTLLHKLPNFTPPPHPNHPVKISFQLLLSSPILPSSQFISPPSPIFLCLKVVFLILTKLPKKKLASIKTTYQTIDQFPILTTYPSSWNVSF